MTAVPRKREQGGGVSLPEDIVFDVLARVPAKALCRFRCVCKRWRALISDPAFVAAQRSRAGPHLVTVFCRAWPLEVRVMDMEGNIVRAFEVQLLDKDDVTNVFGVLQQLTTTRLDLICVLGRRILQPEDDDTSFSAHAMIIDLAAGHAWAVGADTPFRFSSIGRATLSGAFKVLYVAKTYLAGYNCSVTTIPHGDAELATWRQTSAPPISIFDALLLLEKRTTVNGIVYIMSRAWSNPSLACIAAFDLESEEWNMINGPALGIQDEMGYAKFTLTTINEIFITELKGTLGVVLVGCVLNDDHYYVIVWLLIDSSNALWEKEYTIHMPKAWGLPKQLWALDDGRILFLVSETEIRYQPRHVLVFYDPSTNAFTKFRDIEIVYGDALVLYTGSLLC